MNKNKIYLKNVSRVPEIYYCKHIEKGVVNYEIDDKTVTVLIDDDALNKMDATFQGRGVFVFHQDVALDELKEKADGYVVESFYNKLDGWHWAKFLIISDEAHRVIKDGWSVSNCYQATEFGESGVYHNIDFDQKVLSGVYEHLAIVPNPRYEGAKIFSSEDFKSYNNNLKNELENLRNSKDEKINGGKAMLTKEEINKAVARCEDGEKVVLKDAIEFMKNSKKKNEEEKEEQEFEVSMESEIDVDGETMTVKDLVNSYRAGKKKNAEDEEEKKKKENELKEEEEKKKKENELEEEEEKKKKENELKEEEEKKKKENEAKDEEEKKKANENKEEYDNVKNSIENNSIKGSPVEFETMLDRLENGKKKY